MCEENARLRACVDAWRRYADHHGDPCLSVKDVEIVGWIRRDRYLWDQAVKATVFVSECEVVADGEPGGVLHVGG